ncbi:MAG TPA: thioesterase family protein [Anaerolineales bacterium]|nr:thioesterase family protein [Anaerolineales bacterium]
MGLVDLDNLIHPGMNREETFQVEERYAALSVGSGTARVLATPWMITFMERVSHHLLAEHLPEGYSSVGIHVDVRHLAPTPVGMAVRIRSEVSEVNGFQVAFLVQSWDDIELVGEGRHQRMVIEEARFLRRVEKKRG